MKKAAVSKTSLKGKSRIIPEVGDKPSDGKAAAGGFKQFFSKQRTKVNPKEPVGKVLTQFAEEDLKRIAVLMQEWLVKDEKQQQKRDHLANQSRNRKTR